MSDFPVYNNGGDNRPSGNQPNFDLYQYTGEGQQPNRQGQGPSLPDLYSYTGERQGPPNAGTDLYQYGGDQGQQPGDPFANDRMPGNMPTYSDRQTMGDGTVIINNYYCRGNVVVNENGGYDYRNNSQYDYRPYLPPYVSKQQMEMSSYYPEDYMQTPGWQRGVAQVPIEAPPQSYQSYEGRQAMMSVYNRAFNPDYQGEYPPAYATSMVPPNYWNQQPNRSYYSGYSPGYYPENTSVIAGPAGYSYMQNPGFPPSPEVAASMGNVGSILGTILPMVNAGAGIYMGIENSQRYHHRRFYR